MAHDIRYPLRRLLIVTDVLVLAKSRSTLP